MHEVLTLGFRWFESSSGSHFEVNMKITRRTFNWAIPAIAAIPWLAKSIPVKAAELKPSRLTIADICAVSYPAVLADMRRGNLWASPVLNSMTAEGRIKIMPLAASVEKVFDGPNGIYRKIYDVKQLNCPVAWTVEDEARNPTENMKIDLVATMLENVVNSHEYMIEEMLEGHVLIVSQHYRLEKSNTYETMMGYPERQIPAHYFLTYTAFCKIPLEDYPEYATTQSIL